LVDLNITMLWEVVNFLVLMYLLKRFLYKPVMNMLDSRRQKIKGDLEQARRQKEEAHQLKEKHQSELKEARQKAQQIIDEAEGRGKERAQEIITEAREEAERIKERNLAEIEQARQEAADELRQEVASISMMVASKFLREKLNEKEHQELIQKYIEDLEAARLGEAK